MPHDTLNVRVTYTLVIRESDGRRLLLWTIRPSDPRRAPISMGVTEAEAGG